MFRKTIGKFKLGRKESLGASSDTLKEAGPSSAPTAGLSGPTGARSSDTYAARPYDAAASNTRAGGLGDPAASLESIFQSLMQRDKKEALSEPPKFPRPDLEHLEFETHSCEWCVKLVVDLREEHKKSYKALLELQKEWHAGTLGQKKPNDDENKDEDMSKKGALFDVTYGDFCEGAAAGCHFFKKLMDDEWISREAIHGLARKELDIDDPNNKLGWAFRDSSLWFAGWLPEADPENTMHKLRPSLGKSIHECRLWASTYQGTANPLDIEFFQFFGLWDPITKKIVYRTRHSFQVFTQAEDPASGIISNRPIARCPDAAKNVELYSTWLKSCQESHKCKALGGELPTRLIEIAGTATDTTLHEALVCAAMYTKVKQGGALELQRMSYTQLRDQVFFLSQLFRGEFIFPTQGLDANLEQALQSLSQNNVITLSRDSDGKVETIELSMEERERGRENYDFFCFLVWPFIEASWLGAVSLMILTPPLEHQGDLWLDMKKVQDHAQLLGKTLYHQGDLSYFEAVNKETLKNAYTRFEEEGIILVTKSRDAKVGPTVRLADDWKPARSPGDGHLLPEGKLWNFADLISQSRREGKNRRDGNTVSTRVLGLADLVGRKLYEDTLALSKRSGKDKVDARPNEQDAEEARRKERRRRIVGRSAKL